MLCEMGENPERANSVAWELELDGQTTLDQCDAAELTQNCLDAPRSPLAPSSPNPSTLDGLTAHPSTAVDGRIHGGLCQAVQSDVIYMRMLQDILVSEFAPDLNSIDSE